MPGGDASGPAGLGPMTGRGAGYCAGYSVPGFMNPVAGRGLRFGRGLGFGFRGGHRAYPYAEFGYGYPFGVYYGIAPAPKQELEALQNQAKNLENALGQITERITELTKEKEKK